MSPSVICYTQPNKAKSRLVLEAFAAGCGGRISEQYELQTGTACFFGVVSIEGLWRAARARGDYVYCDNSYWDASRGTHFRAARNALQDEGRGAPDWQRFRAIGLKVEPWRRDGRHIAVIAQSEHFMREVAMWPGGALAWQEHVLLRLKACTDRPIIVRHWTRDKIERARTLRQDIDGAWAVVTHVSAAANEALLAGIPVFVTGRCAASRMGLSQLESIEYPRYPDGRSEWAAALAAAQWTIEELRSGAAWRSLNV